MRLCSALLTVCFMLVALAAEERDSVSQYGVTWYFDKAYPVGQFITGDWWVVGPVTVVRVDPAPGPADKNEQANFKKDQYGVAGLKQDFSMRNGSMIIREWTPKMGYDSRGLNYDASVSLQFPLELEHNRSLISSISYKKQGEGKNLAHPIMWAKEKGSGAILKCAAVLTCLEKAPPEDAFRPAYAGDKKIIYQEQDIHWDLLPDLEPAEGRPDWQQLARYMERPWIDHFNSWVLSRTGPAENNPGYGREHARLTGLVGLSLLTKAPRADKRKAMIGLIQYGIDIQGLLDHGQRFKVDGGHYSGRKFPLMFAGMMLGEQRMLEQPAEIGFQEDFQTYYGDGWAGQQVLYQMAWHTGPKPAYEEKPPEQWDKNDKKSEGYRVCCNGKAWIGSALAIRLLKGIRHWNHDAFFDYCDRWMGDDTIYAPERGKRKRPSQEGTAYDAFVTNMWEMYRVSAPQQDMGDVHRKWVWVTEDGRLTRTGKWVDNPRPADFREQW